MIETTLQDCLIAVIDNRGVTPHKRGTEWQDNGVPVLSANNVKTSGLQKLDEIRYIPEDIYPLWMKMPLEKGDIIMTSEAPAGEVYYWDSDEKVVLGQRLFGLKVKSDINSKYLKYYLQSSIGQKAIKGQNSGSTVFGIAASTFPQIVLNLLERENQDVVANLLYDIDSKISNNNAICADLEAMAKLLYDYWFVQFDFPDEKGKPYKSSGGKMVWNEDLKQEIPEGWEVKALSEVFDITMGSSPSGESLNESAQGIEFYQGSTDFGDLYPSIRVFTTAPVRFAKAQDVLMSVRAPVGDLNIAMNDCCIGRGLAAIHHESTMYAWSTMKTFKPYFDFFNGNGTTFGALTSDDLKGQLIVSPNPEVLMVFCQKVKDIGLKLRELSIESQQLASLRDFLLPLLMNGQVKVGEKN